MPSTKNTDKVPTSTPAQETGLWDRPAMEEITEALKVGVAEGVQACNLGVPILAEELVSR
jgi:hypothetical protein